MADILNSEGAGANAGTGGDYEQPNPVPGEGDPDLPVIVHLANGRHDEFPYAEDIVFLVGHLILDNPSKKASVLLGHGT